MVISLVKQVLVHVKRGGCRRYVRALQCHALTAHRVVRVPYRPPPLPPRAAPPADQSEGAKAAPGSIRPAQAVKWGVSVQSGHNLLILESKLSPICSSNCILSGEVSPKGNPRLDKAGPGGFVGRLSGGPGVGARHVGPIWPGYAMLPARPPVTTF